MNFINFLKRAEFGWNLLKSKCTNKTVPFLLQFSVTNRCNLKCRYCYAKYYERKQKDLPKSEIFKIIDGAYSIGTVRINLVGGEPLIRRDIGEIISYIHDKGIECALTSNGFLVAEKIEEIKKLDSLCLSLDGDEEANDYNRGTGSFNKLMEAINIAKKYKIKIQIATVLTVQSIKSIDFLVNLAGDKGFMIGFTTPITQSSDGKTIAIENLPADDELRCAIEKIINLKKNGAPILFSKESYQFALQWPFGYEKDKIIGERPLFKYPKCYAGRYWGIIDVNGDLYPCPALVDVVQSQNCLEKGFKEAWALISNHKCYTCHLPCNNEFNFIFALNWKILINLFMNYQKQN